jgi:hypothetical protein
VNPEQPFAPGWLGVAFMLEGQPTAALGKIDPKLRGLRADPRFASFLKKMNLPPN